MCEIELISWIKMDVTLNNLQRLICHKLNQLTTDSESPEGTMHLENH